jgi:hypothetical protein
MFLSNIINTEGALIKPFSKKKKTSFLKKDFFSHISWKKTSASSLSSTKKIDSLKKRYSFID